MCNCNNHSNPFKRYIHALHCPTRWKIIYFIGNGKKSTTEIHQFLSKSGEKITRSGLYFHLTELKKADIIDVTEYREEGGGAPEKVWKLKTKEITISLVEVEK